MRGKGVGERERGERERKKDQESTGTRDHRVTQAMCPPAPAVLLPVTSTFPYKWVLCFLYYTSQSQLD